MTQQSQESLTVKEVARMLKVSERTIQREVKAGKLPAYRVGRILRFDLSDVDQYKKRQREELQADTKSNSAA